MKKIFINPGHGSYSSGGSYDSGAVGQGGLQEHTVVSKIGQLLNTKINKLCATKVYSDGNLTAVCNQSNMFKADVFVSIHCNAFGTTPEEKAKAYGIETYCYRLGSQGEELAKGVQEQLVRLLARHNRGVKQNTYKVLRETNAIAVLAEIGFISNREEEALMKTPAWQERAAEALAMALSNYCSLGYRPVSNLPGLYPLGIDLGPFNEPLATDGVLGSLTVSRWQKIMKTLVDGIISGQSALNKKYHQVSTAIHYGGGGSSLVRAVQGRLGVDVDGQLGPNTISAIQRHLGVTVDGYFAAKPSETVRALQRRLNTGAF